MERQWATGGGKIILDLFHKDNQRTSYNGIIIGKMGSGKSTLLKKMLIDRAVRGDYIRGYDLSGEFRYLVEELGGNMEAKDRQILEKSTVIFLLFLTIAGIVHRLKILKASELPIV